MRRVRYGITLDLMQQAGVQRMEAILQSVNPNGVCPEGSVGKDSEDADHLPQLPCHRTLLRRRRQTPFVGYVFV